MRILVAFLEAVTATIATYLIGALVLFGVGGDASIPGLVSARETKTVDRLNTAIDFHPYGGGILLVVFTACFYLMHRRRARLSNPDAVAQ
jgi:hypothetical protein